MRATSMLVGARASGVAALLAFAAPLYEPRRTSGIRATQPVELTSLADSTRLFGASPPRQ